MIKNFTYALTCIALLCALISFSQLSNTIILALTLTFIMLWFINDKRLTAREIAGLEDEIKSNDKKKEIEHVSAALEIIGYHVSIMASKNKDPMLKNDFRSTLGAISQTQGDLRQ